VHFHNNAHHKFQNQKSFSIIHGAAGNENVAADGHGAESHGIGGGQQSPVSPYVSCHHQIS